MECCTKLEQNWCELRSLQKKTELKQEALIFYSGCQ